MGLIKAALGSAGGVLADQWKEYFYCESLPADVLMVRGQKRASGRSSNTKGSDNIITNGSIIAVADGQCSLARAGRKSANLKQRQQGNTTEVIAYADRANDRLRRKYVRIAMRSKANIAKTAVARELACFVWGMMNGRRTQKHIDSHSVAGQTVVAFFSGWLSRASRLRRWLGAA